MPPEAAREAASEAASKAVVAARRAVVAKLRRVIANNGLNGAWTPASDLIPIESGTDAEFVAALRLAVAAYHPHSRLVREAAWHADNRGSEAERRLRRPPDFRWLAKPRIGVIKLFTYVNANGEGWDTRPAHTVDATRKMLDGWLAEGAATKARGVIVDLRAHEGGNFRVALHALGGHLLRGRATFAWVDREGRDTPTVYDGEKERTSGRGGKGKGKDVHSVSGGVRVAVLVGPKTSSSGEFTAALFKGKAGARLFGAPTEGSLSANAEYELSGGLSVNLTTDLVRTSDGVLQKDERLLPDVVTGRPMAAAVAWLRGAT